MTVLFMDGFDHYASADVYKKWTSGAGGAVTNTQKRTGTQSLTLTNDSVEKAFANCATVCVGAGLFNPNINTITVFTLKDGATTQVYLAALSDGSVKAYVGAAVVGTSATGLFSAHNVWNYFEIKVLFHNSAGTIEVWINGVKALDLSGIDTTATANAYANVLRLSDPSIGGNWDDVYIDDSDVLGPIKIETLYPTGAGATTDFTPLSGDNYTNVDEALQDGDTSYVASDTPGDVDTYAFGNLVTTAGLVKGVQVIAVAKKDDAGAKTIAPVVRPVSTDRVGDTVTLADSYTQYRQIYNLNPEDSAAWEIADVNGSEFGIKLVS